MNNYLNTNNWTISRCKNVMQYKSIDSWLLQLPYCFFPLDEVELQTCPLTRQASRLCVVAVSARLVHFLGSCMNSAHQNPGAEKNMAYVPSYQEVVLFVMTDEDASELSTSWVIVVQDILSNRLWVPYVPSVGREYGLPSWDNRSRRRCSDASVPHSTLIRCYQTWLIVVPASCHAISSSVELRKHQEHRRWGGCTHGGERSSRKGWPAHTPECWGRGGMPRVRRSGGVWGRRDGQGKLLRALV